MAASGALPHVAALLATYAGVGLVTSARLKWDPSLYVAVREVSAPLYRAACAALPALSAALLLAQHLALLALSGPPTRRRVLLLVYAGCMSALVATQCGLCGVLAARVVEWQSSARAREVSAALVEAHEHLQRLLDYLTRYHALPAKLADILQEAEADLMTSARMAALALVTLLVLQLLAALLAVLAARRTPARIVPPLPPAASKLLPAASCPAPR